MKVSIKRELLSFISAKINKCRDWKAKTDQCTKQNKKQFPAIQEATMDKVQSCPAVGRDWCKDKN